MSTTAMQDMLQYIRSTLPMDLDWPRMLESKAESLLKKEKEDTIGFAYGCTQHISLEDIETHYNKTYKNE